MYYFVLFYVIYQHPYTPDRMKLMMSYGYDGLKIYNPQAWKGFWMPIVQTTPQAMVKIALNPCVFVAPLSLGWPIVPFLPIALVLVIVDDFSDSINVTDSKDNMIFIKI